MGSNLIQLRSMRIVAQLTSLQQCSDGAFSNTAGETLSLAKSITIHSDLESAITVSGICVKEV